MRLEELRRGGRQDESDREAGGNGERNADSRGEARAEEDFREDRRERRAEERRIDVRRERFALEPGIQREAKYDAPDVQQVLPEQPETEQQEEARDRGAVHFCARLVINETCAQGQQPGIHAAGADPADAEVVSEEGVPRREDRDKAAGDGGRAIHGKAKRDEYRGVRGDNQQDRPVRNLHRACIAARHVVVHPGMALFGTHLSYNHL